MGILGSMANSLIKNFTKIEEPTFIKEFSKENQQLGDLIELSEKLKEGDKKDRILRDINYLRAGIRGEENVDYEIKNSFIPLVCLHDIRLEYKNHTAQFDFIVITKKFICVLETKKLVGNIIVNSDGDFIRTFKWKSGKTFREGMYSPIVQNERHVNVLKSFLKDGGINLKVPVKSLVVMANDKTIIDKRYCPKAVSMGIRKYDQIASYMKDNLNDKKNESEINGKNMVRIAEFIKENHSPIKFDLIGKYGITEEDYLQEEVPQQKEKTVEQEIPFNSEIEIETSEKEIPQKEALQKADEKNQTTGEEVKLDKLRDALKKFRLEKSREENLKAYMVFNNKQMEELMAKNPECEEDILDVSGFGKVKVDKYGGDILNIFRTFR